ncbi:DUF4406 domain-containing protein [Changpingibacter yushuensis]|uniref:DUF4406 domain-containing protein n=1 Tax=Changpingibacter yushuensis TaxID=2758440 RepID=UPI0015F47C93|nr:DUF4406 domain-containing protein [Changpingibacter yushuensis]
MNIYLAGPMSNLPDFNRPAFMAFEEKLAVAGYVVLNPARVRLPEDATWLDYMRYALRNLSHADGVAMLPGWEDSIGATIEHDLATRLGLDVRAPDEWLVHTHVRSRNT